MNILNNSANSADLEAIRKVIDFSLTSTNLSDANINLSPFLPQAEMDVKARVAGWEAVLMADDEDAVRLKNAVIHMCAGKLAPSSIVTTALSFSTRDVSFSRPAYNAQRKQAELYAVADGLIDQLTSTTAPDMPVMFTLARGRRGA